MEDNEKGLAILAVLGLAAWAFSGSGGSSDEASQYDNVPDTQKPKGMHYAIFNRNPGNIKKSKHIKYPGEITPDGSTFKKFKNWAHGWAAMVIHLRRYAAGKVTGERLTTIREIISTWAPPSDGNQTENYIQYVCKATKMGADAEVDVQNKDIMISFVKAMAMREDNTTPKKDSEIQQGWDIANAFKIV